MGDASYTASVQFLMKVEGGSPVCLRQHILDEAVRQRSRHLEKVASHIEFEMSYHVETTHISSMSSLAASCRFF